MTVTAIAAVARDGAVGRNGTLPWRIPEDLAHFAACTDGHALIMGSSTFASIGRPLPGRRMIVLSRSHTVGEDTDGVVWEQSPHDALASALSFDSDPFVIGGPVVWDLFLPDTTHIWWTDIDMDVPHADAWFPALIDNEWEDVYCYPGRDPRVKFRLRYRVAS